MKVYRVENPRTQEGLWRRFDGTVSPIFSSLTVGKCRNMPMEDSDFYRFGGKQWFAATDTKEKLKAWFDVLDVIELEKLGFGVYEFDVESTRTVSEYEVVFTRDTINSAHKIDPAEIWEEYNRLKRVKCRCCKKWDYVDWCCMKHLKTTNPQFSCEDWEEKIRE